MMHRFVCGLIVGAVLPLGAAAQAEQIRFGDGGSIFGGATWTITPNDHVRYDAYQIAGGLAVRDGWVWENREARQGHITFAIPGAFATAAEIAREGLAGVGPAPAFQSTCADAGSLILEVAAQGVTYQAYVDRCAGQDSAPPAVQAHFEVLERVHKDIITTLGLDRLE